LAHLEYGACLNINKMNFEAECAWGLSTKYDLEQGIDQIID